MRAVGFVILRETKHPCPKRMELGTGDRFGHDVRNLVDGRHPFEGDGPTCDSPAQHGILGRQKPRAPAKPFEMRPVCHCLSIGVDGVMGATPMRNSCCKVRTATVYLSAVVVAWSSAAPVLS